jgi:hypothetical protein
MSAAVKDEKVLQALAAVASLGGFTLKSVATTDDFEQRTVTVKFTRISDGHVQEAFNWEREPVLQAEVDANGHVDKVTTLKPGDLAETEAQANEEIAQAAGDPHDDEPQRDPNQPLVGEVAAAAKRRR